MSDSGAGSWKLLLDPDLARAVQGDKPVLTGDLGEIAPSELLNFLDQGRRTGALLTRSGGIERALVMIDGDIAWACSSSPGERLGSVRHQCVEIFLGLLVAREGSFIFLRGVNQAALPAVLELETQAMLLDGLRRLDEMELYRSRVRGGEVVLQPTGKAASDSLPPEAQQLLALADGKRTLLDLAAATALGEFEATKAAFRLLEQGFLRL